MLKYLIVSILIFCVLASSRFIPHPPNFTSLIALSFYVPVFLGSRYLPALLLSFAITDFIIGYHTGTHWTWGSIFLIGLIAPIFAKNIKLPQTQNNDLLAIYSAGAYGFTMASNYNTRGKVAEIAIENGQDRLIRRRETFEDLIAHEEEYL